MSKYSLYIFKHLKTFFEIFVSVDFSMDGSIINSYFSQFTSQTSLASFNDIYSITSIYQVDI
jgi:hypothetical protein